MPGRKARSAVFTHEVPGIHVLLVTKKQDVDGRNKSGHDGSCLLGRSRHHLWISVPVPWLVNNSSSTACCILPSLMTTPSTPCSSAWMQVSPLGIMPPAMVPSAISL